VPERDQIAAAIEPVLATIGLELFDVELTGSGRTRTLRVIVDRDGGVDLDAITAASERISPVLDTESALRGPYALEVSSPGLERPLRRPEHFRRAVGDTVTVKTRRPDGPVERLRGPLLDADEDGIALDTAEGVTRVRYDDIVQSRTVFEFGPAPKAGKSKNKRAKKKKEVAR
jgi:ribosome maturation factor RimP